jgi:hypothetical protein
MRSVTEKGPKNLNANLFEERGASDVCTGLRLEIYRIPNIENSVSSMLVSFVLHFSLSSDKILPD